MSDKVITCPSCSVDNRFAVAYQVTCSNCDTALMRYEEKESKTLKNVLIAGFLTGGFFLGVDVYSDHRRYDVAVEYAILSMCKNDGNMSSSKLYRGEKNEILHNTCICSLRKTQNEVSFYDYQSQTKNFMDVFERHYKECWLDVESKKRAD